MIINADAKRSICKLADLDHHDHHQQQMEFGSKLKLKMRSRLRLKLKLFRCSMAARELRVENCEKNEKSICKNGSFVCLFVCVWSASGCFICPIHDHDHRFCSCSCCFWLCFSLVRLLLALMMIGVVLVSCRSKAKHAI